MNIGNIQGLKNLSVLEVSGMLKYEHPQIIALILAYQESDFAAKVLSMFTERLRHDVMLRIMTLGPVHAFWLNVLDSSIQKSIAEQSANRILEIDSLKKATEVLENMEDSYRYNVLDAVREYDPDCAQRIVDASDIIKD